jgi:hypothetical protein
MMQKEITLCAVPYQVTEIDKQVIFLDKSGFAFCHSQFTLEWKGCGWYLVEMESSGDRIYIPHIVAAYNWCKAHYRLDYANGTATAHYQDEPIKDNPAA